VQLKFVAYAGYYRTAQERKSREKRPTSRE